MFYPVSKVNDYPWDLFYDSRTASIRELAPAIASATGAERIEEHVKGQWELAILRRSVSGYETPISIRLRGAPMTNIAHVLNQDWSYKHSYITHYGAVCLWPRLSSRRQMREYKPVYPVVTFPEVRCVVPEVVQGLTVIQSNSSSDCIDIKTTSASSVEVIAFSIPGSSMAPSQCDEMIRSHVIAVSRDSVKYVGNTQGV
ncbi:hypothetical protein GcM3_142008 [Golovinomyces cichoracearum]|uniref:Uncharacterized protein n=1 Tax=Golovinomyces cichoracearum TaxID=62708 RepID=A0A420I023_9PEZI|nr:hypothetical protein GcM3_142008 [Golovinomyces cichoracearum]